MCVAGAAILLQHWLRHYMDLGFGREQMLLVVHSNHDGAACLSNGVCSDWTTVTVLRLAYVLLRKQICNRWGRLTVCCQSVGTIAAGNLDHVMRVLQQAGIRFESWIGTPYSSDAHLEERSLLTRASKCVVTLLARPSSCAACSES
jgi:hypothetical protein